MSKNIKNFINSSSLGVYTKYLAIVDGEKYLVKSGREDSENKSSILEPVTECICYELAKNMGIKSAEYYLKEKNGSFFCYSKWFYNEEKEQFYSINKLMKILRITRENLYFKLINQAPNLKEDIDNMIIFDFIINNTDRHLKNFGVIDSNDGIKFAPLYDNGLALCSHLDDDYIEEEEIEDLILDSDYSKCFESTNRKQLSLVKKHSLNLDFDYVQIVNKYKKHISEKRYQLICELLKERIEVIKECFQNHI